MARGGQSLAFEEDFLATDSAPDAAFDAFVLAVGRWDHYLFPRSHQPPQQCPKIFQPKRTAQCNSPVVLMNVWRNDEP